MGESKVLSRFLGVPRSSCHDMCKYGFEHDSPTKAKIPRPTRETLGKISERTKVPGSTKLPSEIKSQTTCQVNGQEMQGSTKRVAAPFVNQPSDSKIKPLEENESRRHQRRYSDNFIPGRSSKLLESLLDGSSSRLNQSCKMEKDGGSSELSKKKSVFTSTFSLSPKSSVKKVSSTTSSNNSPRKISQLNSRTSLTTSKTGKISHENVTKKTSHLKESKTRSNTTGISQESNAKESSLHRDGPKRGKTASSSLCSPSFPPSSGGGSLRNIDTTTQSSVSSSSLMSPSSYSANESAKCDGTSSSTSRNGATTQKQDTKPQKSGQVGFENEDCSPKLLKFKKGKTIYIQSEKDSPRKQKFRKVTIKDECKNENGNGNPIGKSLRKSTADGHSYAAKDEVMKVNL